MESKQRQYRKALEKILSLCIFHVGDKQDLTEEVRKIAVEALRRRTRKIEN